jgi:hypothetical protein
MTKMMFNKIYLKTLLINVPMIPIPIPFFLFIVTVLTSELIGQIFLVYLKKKRPNTFTFF